VCDYGYVENSAYAFYQLNNSAALLWLTIGIILCNTFYKAFGVGVTKYSSGVARSIIRTACTVTVWLLSAGVFGLQPWQPLTIPGFVLLTLGTFMYNEIIVFKCWGFDYNTAEARKSRKLEES
jgi:hypothetical protein